MAYASFTPEPLDRSRIELTEDNELRFWTCYFACTSQELLDAIEAVGIDASAVSSFIAMHRWICSEPTSSLGDHEPYRPIARPTTGSTAASVPVPS
jgi:hypothetical protein